MKPTTSSLTLVAALAAAGCGPGDRTYTIDETRVLEEPRPEQRIDADIRARLGPAGAFERFGGPDRPAEAGATAPKAVHGAESLRWSAPAGWTQGPAKQMRLVTFTPGGRPGVECYVTVLGGTGGGLDANVNRWRQQLSLAPLSAQAISELPTLGVLGRAAPLIEIDGGALGLYGLVCELGHETVFVKMTGPMDELRAERDRFVAFCTSLSEPE